jgi:hypothetical protein
MKTTRLILATAATLTAIGAQGQAKVSPNPMLPAYGTPIQVELDGTDASTYLPATRYSIVGQQITIDYEYLGVGFGPFGLEFGDVPLDLGELAPGNYSMTARLHDINQAANAAPKVVTGSIAVVPPDSWGLYTVPVAPQAHAATSVTLKSAAYFDPASMKATVSGNVVRVDFVYNNTALAGGSTPDGMRTWGSVRIPADLASGTYRLEGWGRVANGQPEKFFERTVTVARTTPVIEYYSPSLDHYFMTLDPNDIAQVEAGRYGDWKRTGQAFNAWARASDAPPNAVPVCRFYALGPNSHFYTGSAAECDFLKGLEQQGRAQDAAAGRRFMGWAYEGIAFYTVLPVNGDCPAGMKPVFRHYNDRYEYNDSNHRFTSDVRQRYAMSGWNDEGAQMCAPL